MDVKKSIGDIGTLLTKPHSWPLLLNKLGLLKNRNDEDYLRLMFRARMGKELNLEDPKTICEKIQWLKLYNRKPEYHRMVDKYTAKEFAAERVGAEHVIPAYGVWDRVEDIDFAALPEQFVLKCSHDSGGLVVCRDKSQLDVAAAKAKLKQRLEHRFYYHGREWPYKNVKPRILAEKYMEDTTSQELKDYKFFCFDGEPKFALVASGRFAEGGPWFDYFDMDWNHLPLRRPATPQSTGEIIPPENYGLMQELARKIAKDKPFVRADFYEVDGKVYFGEITFFPASGLSKFEPTEWEYKMGDWITLPQKRP